MMSLTDLQRIQNLLPFLTEGQIKDVMGRGREPGAFPPIHAAIHVNCAEGNYPPLSYLRKRNFSPKSDQTNFTSIYFTAQHIAYTEPLISRAS